MGSSSVPAPVSAQPTFSCRPGLLQPTLRAPSMQPRANQTIETTQAFERRLSMRRTFVCLAVVCLLMLAAGSSATGQDTATIVGTVTDTTGAVIPGAKVVVSNPEKGLVRQLESNSVGEYTAAKLPIGNYVVAAEAPNFRKLVRSGITLEVGQTQRVDLKLAVGQVSQEVTVTGNTVKVETENGTISNVVTGKQIASLNLNGRNFTSR